MVHIVGPAIRIGDRTIQRCALCGEKLFDSKDCTCAEWEAGRMLRVQGGTAALVNETDDDPSVEALPEDSCYFELDKSGSGNKGT